MVLFCFEEFNPSLIVWLYMLRILTFSIDFATYRTHIYSFCIAPSPPRDVSVRIIRPLLVEVRWKVPAVTKGSIVHYTVYAIPLVSTEPTRGKRQTDSATLPKTLKMVRFSNSISCHGATSVKKNSAIFWNQKFWPLCLYLYSVVIASCMCILCRPVWNLLSICACVKFKISTCLPI